jgi:hypothetical protein
MGIVLQTSSIADIFSIDAEVERIRVLLHRPAPAKQLVFVLEQDYLFGPVSAKDVTLRARSKDAHVGH